MVLTKDDAVYGWRKMLGDKDPAAAKASDPSRYVYFIQVVGGSMMQCCHVLIFICLIHFFYDELALAQ